MTAHPDTICAIATPPGEGGIGIVRISGPHARSILERLFRSRGGCVRTQWGSHQLVPGVVVDAATNDRIDEVMAVFMAGPRSYTGEDVVELQGHGGSTPLRAVMDLALRAGARAAQPGEFTRRAFLHGRLDLAQSEAVLDVIRARTDAALRAAMSQLGGRLSQRIRSMQDGLLDWIAHLEAQIDFPEDDVPASSAEQSLAQCQEFLSQIEALLAAAEAGRVLRDGLRVAIVGRPNVGKSSLLNALAGEARAIVTDIPGTTRDSVEAWINVAGIPMQMVDTAGLREPEDVVERLGVERTHAHLDTADLIVAVVDAAAPLTPDDDTVARQVHERDRPCVVALNKIDCLTTASRDASETAVRSLFGLPDDSVVSISALHGEGLDALRRELTRLAGDGMQAEHDVVGGNLRHRDALYRCRMALQAAQKTAQAALPADFLTIDLRTAVLALGEITGTTVTDEIVDRIFSQFCLGK